MLQYHFGQGDYENWIVSETAFDPALQGKAEAVMSLGNGYLGLRAATEEAYIGQVRNVFVAGTYNRFDANEVTELPNAADVTELAITINGERFSLEKGTVRSYRRDLNVKTGELIRQIVWENSKGAQFALTFRRFVSLRNLHVIGMRAEITALNSEADITIGSGINAQVTNTGAQHFHEGEKRIFDKKYIQLVQTTTETNIDFVFNTVHSYTVDGVALQAEPQMAMDRRKVFVEESIALSVGQTLVVEKLSNVYTSRDKAFDRAGYSLQELRDYALADLQAEAAKGYEQLFAESVQEWEQRWAQMEIQIDSEQAFDQLAIRFAHYHLMVMTPAHDNRFGIAAKGLSGEGYKGHSFWDTEIFILPFFSFTYPDVARKLLEYRYNTIAGARRKALANGYEGAMYPWESAFTGDEETPVWGAVDIVTGEATKIWSGFIEQHITGDITYAVWQYYMITGDQEFMNQYGYEMMFDTATFWASRLEWSEEQQRYHILNVVGPDEYKEHVDNNAFTNYIAHWNIQMAIRYYRELEQQQPELWQKLSEQLRLTEAYAKWTSKVEHIYLPQPREADLVIPQDDTYLQKEIIDLTKYKQQEHVGSIFKDYNLERVNDIQVSKQADIMVLFFLLEDRFSQAVKRANWNYYEPKTLHDSSLSLSTHSVLASDMEDRELAYELFERAARIDLGPNMKSSDHGMHTASIGGVWQCVVYGFGGVRMLNGSLRINPKLPKQWKQLKFPLYWQNDRLEVTVTAGTVVVENMTKCNPVLSLQIAGQECELTGKLEFTLTTV